MTSERGGCGVVSGGCSGNGVMVVEWWAWGCVRG